MAVRTGIWRKRARGWPVPDTVAFMGLDDAIEKARKQPRQMAPGELDAQWKERDQRRIAELLPDVLRRLTPYWQGEYFYFMRQSATGRYQGPYGRRLDQVHCQRCWLIKEIRPNPKDARSDLRRVMLFSDDGTPFTAQVFRNTDPSHFITDVAPAPVGFDDYESQAGLNGLLFGGWVDLLEKDFATAIVRYERAAGAAGALSNERPKQ